MATTVYEIPWLTIHGSRATAISQGYPNAQDTQSVDPDIFPPGTEFGHFNGNPAFCMYLKLEEFERTVDNIVKCVINPGGAYLRMFPATGQTRRFGYSFTIKAGLYTGILPQDISTIDDSLITGAVDIIVKGLSPYHESWIEPGQSPQTGHDNVYYTNSNKITITSRDTSGTNVYLMIFNYSVCTCNQAYKNRPVFIADITQQIPPANPYIWQYQQDNKWHLVKPFYIRKHKNGQDCWCNVETDEPYTP